VDPAGDVRTDGDAELLAGLRRRPPLWRLFPAVGWLPLAAVQLDRGDTGFAVAYLLLSAGWVAMWWAAPEPRVRSVTADALVVRRGWRMTTVSRVDVRDAQPLYGGRYGVTLVLEDSEPLALAGTAPRLSVAEAQAAALRRWAGLDR
jgi:hypothetical protein